jgi:DNA-binding transcriptional LysR family regulator
VLVSPDGGGFAGATDEALAALGRSRRVVLSLPSFLLVAPLIAGNDFVAVMPRRLALLQQAELDVFTPPLAIPGYDVHAAWHPRHQRDPGHAWLRRLLAETAA